MKGFESNEWKRIERNHINEAAPKTLSKASKIRWGADHFSKQN